MKLKPRLSFVVAESVIFARADPSEFGFEFLALAWFEVELTASGFADDAFAQDLPLEAAHGLFQTFSRI